MRNRPFLYASLIALLLVCSPAYAVGPVNDAIVAIVNSDVITMKDLKDYIGGIYRQLKVEQHSPAEIQEIMASYEEKGINQLIEDKLILAAATQKGLELRPDVVDKRLKEIRGRYLTEDDFLTALNSQGLTITDLRTKLMNQMKARYIVDVEVKDKIFVNPQEVTKYYNEHPQEFVRKTKYSLESIYVSYDRGKQEARNRAAEARARLAAGEDFQKVHKEYSELPSVGMMEQGQMVPEVEKVVFGLQVGDVSPAVEVEGGIYVFKVTGILPGRVETLQESKDKIYNKLYDALFQKKFREWIDKLRKKSYVEVRD
jgi:peptidyl-prolyl cis-trans isomerase SurA